MSENTQSAPVATPRHLWIVGIVALLWNAMGAFDYVMTQTRNADYMAKFTPEQLDFFYGFPAWVDATWALAVWGAVAGSILLLLRIRWAGLAFLISLVCMVATTIHNYFLSNGMEVMGGAGPLAFSAVIFLVSVGLFAYARVLCTRKVLR